MTPKPFDALDRMTPPDLWPEVERRATTPAFDLPSVDARPAAARRRVLGAAAAVAVVVALVGAALAWTGGAGDGTPGDGSQDVHTSPSGPSPPEAGSGTDAELACLDGGLVAGSVPADAVDAPRLGTEVVPGTHARTWTEDGLAVELLVPAPQYVDFLGERTEEVDDPEGTLWFRTQGDVVLLGATGLDVLADIGLGGPCDRFQLAVNGGDEAAERDLALRIARRFEWRPDLGVTDCGPLSPRSVSVVHGPTAAVALTDPGIAGLLLAPDRFHEVSTVTRLSNGRCAVNAVTRGGLRPVVVVSGSDGEYGVISIMGFAVNAIEDPVQTGWAIMGQVQGRSFTIDLGFWCDACVRSEVTLVYPEGEVFGSAEATSRVPISGELSAAPVPGSYGILVVEVEDALGDLRGLYVRAIPGGDFAGDIPEA